MPGEVPKKASIWTGLRWESISRSRGVRSAAETICCGAACWDFWDAAQATSAAATGNTNAFIGGPPGGTTLGTALHFGCRRRALTALAQPCRFDDRDQRTHLLFRGSVQLDVEEGPEIR